MPISTQFEAMDVILFAQIFNDNYLKNSRLDKGNIRSAYPKVVTAILESFQTPTTSGASASAAGAGDTLIPIQSILKESKDFIEICEFLEQAICRMVVFEGEGVYARKEVYLIKLQEELSTVITYILNKTKDKKSFYLPGGWRRGFGGHAVIFKITRMEHNGFQIEIFNSGNGIDKHDSKEYIEQYKLKYAYKKVYHSQQSLDIILSKTLKFCLTDKIATDESTYLTKEEDREAQDRSHADYLYKTLDSIGTQVVKDSEDVKDSEFIRTQHSGTCAKRSYDLMLRDLCVFDGDESRSRNCYKRLKYLIKKNTLEEYLRILTARDVIYADELDQVRRSFRNFTLSVRKNMHGPGQDDFEKLYDKREEIIIFLEKNRGLLNSLQGKKILQIPAVEEVKAENQKEVGQNPVIRFKSPAFVTPTAKDYKRLDTSFLHRSKLAHAQVEGFSLKSYVAELEQIIKNGPYKMFEMVHLLENIHDAVKKYKLPDQFIDFAEDELEAYILCLNIYSETAKSIYGVKVPNKVHALYREVLGKIADKPDYFICTIFTKKLLAQQVINKFNPGISTLDYIGTDRHSDFENARTLSYDPLFDIEIKELLDLLKKSNGEELKSFEQIFKFVTDAIAKSYTSYNYTTDESRLYYYCFVILFPTSKDNQVKIIRGLPATLGVIFNKILLKYNKQIKLLSILQLCHSRSSDITSCYKVPALVFHNPVLICVSGEKLELEPYFNTASFREITVKEVDQSLWLSTPRYAQEYSEAGKLCIEHIRENHNHIEKATDFLTQAQDGSKKLATISARRLSYPHSEPSRAIHILLDIFFGSNMLALKDADYQQYFEQMLFIPTYLDQFLASPHVSLLNQIRYLNDHFFTYLSFFDQDHEADSGAFIFCLRMLALSNLYAIKLGVEHNIISIENATSLGNELLTYLQTQAIEQRINLNPNEKYQIDVLRFMVLWRKRQHLGLSEQEDKYLKMLFFKLHTDGLAFRESLDSNTQSLLDQALSYYHLSFPQLTIEGINQRLYQIYGSGEYSRLPFDLVNNEHFITIFGRDRDIPGEIINQGRLVLFSDGGTQYRAIKNEINYVIQRQYEGKWYQYISNYQLMIDNPEYSVFPKFMGDSHHQYWACNDTDQINLICFELFENNPCYLLDCNHSGAARIVDFEGNAVVNYGLAYGELNLVLQKLMKLGVNIHEMSVALQTPKVVVHYGLDDERRVALLKAESVLRSLARFESNNFIKTTIDTKNRTIKFNLIRYNIEFIVEGYDNDNFRIACDILPDYYLCLDNSTTTRYLDGDFLTLKSSDNKIKLLCLKQIYVSSYDDKKVRTTQRPIRLDAHNISKDSEYIKKLSHFDIKADYSGSEQYFIFDVSGQGKVITHSSIETLFLVYVALVHHNIDAAHYYIDSCKYNGGLIGGQEELQWIYSVMDKLPVPMDDYEATHPREGLDFTSARCRILALMLDFDISGSVWHSQGLQTEHIKFLGQYSSLILSNYISYLEHFRRIPYRQRLDYNEECNILSLLETVDVDDSLRRRFAHRTQTLSKSIMTEPPGVTCETAQIYFYRPDMESLSTISTLLARSDAANLNASAQVKESIALIEQELEKSKQDLLSKVYEMISHHGKIDFLAQVTPALDIDFLIRAYLQNQTSLLNLSIRGTDAIYKQLELFLTLIIKRNAFKQLQLQFQVVEGSAPENLDVEKQKLSQLIDDARTILLDTQSQNRTLIVYQATQEICLRKQQLDLIEAACAGESMLMQMIMGGGKTKVLIPILAQIKATGERLAIVVVPKPLFETTLSDLNKTTTKSFGQQGRAFIFSRSHARDSAASKKMLDFIMRTIRTREYLITTSESIQSIELKYFELLRSMPSEVNQQGDWSLNLGYVGSLLKILKQFSDVIVDEADISFDINKELQYSTGEPLPYDSDYAKFTHEMFNFLNSSQSFIEDKKFIESVYSSQEIDRSLISSILIQKFLEPGGAINCFLTDLNIDHSEYSSAVSDFFKGWELPPIDSWRTKDGSNLEQVTILKIRKFLAFYHIQINQLLPSTINRKHNQHYGLPQGEFTSTIADSLMAIPYEAAKKPKHGSRFANFLEELNYTYQTILFKEIPLSIARIFIVDQFRQAQVNEKICQDMTALIESNSTKLAGKTFKDMDIEKHDILDEISRVLNKCSRFRFYCVYNYSIAKQTYRTHALVSTAISHAQIYQRCLSLTGTPWNREAFHSKLTAKSILDTTSDDKVASYINDKSKTSVVAYEGDKDDKIVLARIFEHRNVNTRCLIDIAGTFKDLSNEEVARKILSLVDQNQIKYILYFDHKNNLCAVNSRVYIKLPNTQSHTIQSVLRCSPSEYFMYYDQQHTTGVDVKQMPLAHALVTIDSHALYRDILQGVMRMRQLAEHQKLTLVVDEKFKTKLL